MKLAILFLLCFVTCSASGKNWAMLFTGSHEWRDYFSHANLCHAYQVLHKAGIPDERIVTVMYNDVADNKHNPFPGELFNNYNRTDVYKGTPLDYTGEEVTVDLVLAALKGDRAKVKALTGREGKVIDSGPGDNVFVFASVHGGQGILLFPDGFMYSKDLNKALEEMHDNKKYAKLVFYLEACKGGSMFETLSKDLDIYAVTAAKPDQNALKNYCDDLTFATCLGGQFSTGWIEKAEQVDFRTYTFSQHFEAIKRVVNFSDPQVYGDLSFMNLPLQDFFSSGQNQSQQVNKEWTPSKPSVKAHSSSVPIPTMRRSNPSVKAHSSSVPIPTMPLTLLQRQVDARPADVELRLQLARLQGLMADVDRFFHLTARRVYPSATPARIASITESNTETIRNWDCYETVLNEVNRSCKGLLHHQKLQGYFLSKLSALVNLCNRETGPVVVEAVLSASSQIESC